VVDYNAALRQGMAPGANLLKAGNRALAYIGFITQRAPRHQLPTGHHCSPARFPTTTLYYAITATWYAGQLLPAVVLNVALIALPLITLGETPFVDVADGI